MARILIIDDDDQVRAMLMQAMRRQNFEAAEARNGMEGLKLNRERPADLIITDIIMPEKEGIETIRELKKEFPDVKIIAMSGGGRIGPDSYLKMARGLGASQTLKKPVDLKVLIAAVNDLLGASS